MPVHQRDRDPVKSTPTSLWFAVGLLTSTAFGDNRVAVVGAAEDAYTKIKYAEGAEPKSETYVVMRGRYFAGATVDRSIERMTFRQLLSYLTPKLAKQQYWPAKSVEAADLLLVVHWGATNPRVGTLEMTGRTSLTTNTSNTAAGVVKAEIADQARSSGLGAAYAPEAFSMGALMNPLSNETEQQLWMDDLDHSLEQMLSEQSSGNLAGLLGYSDALRNHRRGLAADEDETTLRYDLTKERYFIILRAYEMRPKKKLNPPKPVWTLHLNVSSPGNNFRTAMEHMSTASINFVGRTTDRVATVKPKQLEGKVVLGEPIILEQTK